MNTNNQDSNEVWRIVNDYPKYQVSNFGRIKGQKNNIMVGGYDKYGYHYVVISDKGKQYNVKVHRLVALAFIENPLKLPFVNHKDEDKTNNHVDNLEWCTVGYNNSYGTRLKKFRKPVICIETQQIYDGIRVAERETNIPHSYISRCCRNPDLTAGGFHWEYYEGGRSEWDICPSP